jgi:hypothetical protein
VVNLLDQNINNSKKDTGAILAMLASSQQIDPRINL